MGVPLSAERTDYTVPRHAIAAGLDLELEVRQDLIADAAGQAEVPALLAPLLQSQA